MTCLTFQKEPSPVLKSSDWGGAARAVPARDAMVKRPRAPTHLRILGCIGFLSSVGTTTSHTAIPHRVPDNDGERYEPEFFGPRHKKHREDSIGMDRSIPLYRMFFPMSNRLLLLFYFIRFNNFCIH